jgi:hypothetical protein
VIIDDGVSIVDTWKGSWVMAKRDQLRLDLLFVQKSHLPFQVSTMETPSSMITYLDV